MLKRLIKTPVDICKSCKGIFDLQLCYLPLSALQFKIRVKIMVERT
jgi:hypothetical protein